jgi:hypothetical protein
MPAQSVRQADSPAGALRQYRDTVAGACPAVHEGAYYLKMEYAVPLMTVPPPSFSLINVGV